MAKKESCLLILVKMVLMVTILLGAIIAFVFYAKERLNEYFNRGENIVVPDFRGRHLVQVFKDKPPELIIEKGDEKFDPRTPKDHVITQAPPPGTKVKPNKKILLTISLGSKQVSVPELKEKNIRETSLNLLNAQLKEGNRAYINSMKIPRDRIISQSPLPFTNYEILGGVDLLISLGAGAMKAPLPNFIGKSQGEVAQLLTSLGLNKGKVIYKKDPNRAKDLVLTTRPPPYEMITEGTTVDLMVSSGNEKGAGADELKMFETSESSSAAPAGDSNAPPPPKILLPDDAPTDVAHDPDEEEDDEDAQAYGATPSAHVGKNKNSVPISFTMPDGFLPKEVKFIHLSSQGREEVYSGVHKPNDPIKVDVPKAPDGKVLIYINNVLVEERQAN